MPVFGALSEDCRLAKFSSLSLLVNFNSFLFIFNMITTV